MKKYPFKFLDSYNKEDRGIFFGRDEEINALYEMVFQSSIVVVYGASGTGKTSLINCGLAGKFQPHDWRALMIRRGHNINKSLEKALNDAGGSAALNTGSINWFDEWSDDNETTKSVLSPVGRSINAVYQKSFIPIYLIFDQFEELFIPDSKTDIPDFKNEQKQFIQTVQDILEAKLPVKLIFSIREEYLGHLLEFEKEVPQLLRKKLRVEPMNLDKVNDVTKGINAYKDSMVRIKTDEIVEFTKEIFERLKGKEKKLTIELPYLQVFLDKLYINKTNDESHQTEALLSLEDLKNIGDIDDVLQDFLEEQVKNISVELSSDKKVEPETLWKILSKFCTLDGTKEPVSKKDLINQLKSEINENLIEDAVNAFDKKRIVNKSEDEDLYELAHDSLALKIVEKRSEDEIALLEAKRIIKSKVVLKELFNEKQIDTIINPYFDKLSPELTNEEKKLINDSKKAIEDQKREREKAEQKKRVREKMFLIMIFSVIIICLIYALYHLEKNSMKNEFRADVKPIENHIDSVESNILLASFLEKDPTRALQLDKEALSYLDSIHQIDTLRDKKYLFISDYKKEEYVKIDSTKNKKESLVNSQAKSITEQDNALYKIVPPDNPDDTIFDKRFINGIFPDSNDDSKFRVWHAGKEIIDSIKSNRIVQVVFPADSNAMVLYKDHIARYLGTKKYYRELKINIETDSIISIAPIHYDKIGYKMLSAMNDKRIVEWNLNGTKRSSINRYGLSNRVDYDYGHYILYHDSVVSIAISPDRSKIFTASDKGLGILWPADTINVVLDTAKILFSLNQDTILCSAFSNNGKLIVTGSTDHTVKIWNAENGDRIKTLKGHNGSVTSVAFSANDRFIYTGSLDRTFRQWRLPAMDSILNKRPLTWNKTMSFDSLFIKNIINPDPNRPLKIKTAD